MKKLLVALLALVAIASIAGNLFLYQRYSTSRPVMKFGDDAVTIKEYRDSLEYQFGRPVLTKLAISKLIMNSARKASVLPTEKEVDSRIADIERRQPAQLQAARSDPAKMADLRRDLMTEIALENLRIKDVKLSESQVRDFYSKNRAAFQVPTQAQTQIIIAKNEVDAGTARQLLKMKEMKPATIASTQPRLGVVGVNGFNPDWNTLSAAGRKRLSDAVMDASAGDVVTVKTDDIFFVVRVNKRANAEVPSFEKIRPQAERIARLMKAPPRETAIARLYKEADVEFEIPRYETYFVDYAEAAKNTKATASSKTK